ncbi:MAG: 4Fe-4S dicluster domain-containing protein, partial [Oligoflexia bacterium]|nr:4Fe-4S dicluster domain-containing protein [Oligoflexia bacterium]
VIGPVVKRNSKGKKFVFAKLDDANELRLDYDVTLLPPKKEFFGTSQTLLTFRDNTYKDCINPLKKIIFGVHFYDVKAIDMTDYLFSEKNEDWNYLANREAATIVASSVQNIAPRAFFGSIGRDVAPRGHDAFLTKINGGYLFDAVTQKGEALLRHGKFEKASASQISEAEKVNADVMNKCGEKLNHSSAEIARKVRDSFSNKKLWEECSEDCFSCGSCNIVCPTCYCFDVQDNWNLDQVSGERTRYWDACLTEDFAKVSLGGGAEENFREERADRFRHRIMRKAAYLNEKLGGPACVGCGRCSNACTADIADPVNVINKIMEA